MKIKKILDQFNIIFQCKQFGLPLWQCPQLLFLLMGIIIIGSTLATYNIGNRFVDDPQIVALIVIFITAILFIISVIITHSFERLAEANRMKTEFINIVTHQLRSPLTNLKWAIDFLLMNTSPKTKEGYFKILKENAFRMSELVDNLLIVSRIEQGRFELKKKEISLEDILEDLKREFQPFLKASNVKIKLKIQKDLPKIFVDPYQIKLVIENLLSNAIRYSKDKGEIEVQLLKKNKDIRLTVKDEGAGIPKDDQKYIFQKFFRAANAQRHQTQGSGLGLYIAKSIVESLGGKIDFESEESKGSTFWFALPIFTK